MARRNFRFVGLSLLSLLCTVLAVAGQNTQPQANKLPPPSPATPNFSQPIPRPAGAELTVPPGFAVSLYAEDLPGARWLAWSPNGDLFVSQYNQNQITILRDTNNDGKPDARIVYAPSAPGDRDRDGRDDRGQGGRPGLQGEARGGPQGANRGTPPPPAGGIPPSPAAAAVPCAPPQPLQGTTGIRAPMGMAFHRGYFYVANTDSIVRYRYAPGDTQPHGEPQKVVDLPTGGFHGWRNIIFNPSGTKMYVTVGSASNNRAGEDCRRAAILEFNPDGTGYRIFASGLRNPEGLAWQPGTNRLWTAVNERDSLGDDLVPDYITSVREGGFYGWPYSYIGQNYDPRYTGGQPDLVKKALVPDVLIPAHSAALSVTFYTGSQFPQRYRNGAFVGLHGSWNRSRASGYKVIFVPFQDDRPGPIEDFLTGFLVSHGGRNPDGSMAPITQWGRPVSCIVARDGSLLVTDDEGGRIWQIRYVGQ